MLAQLLSDSHRGVQLTAAISLRQVATSLSHHLVAAPLTVVSCIAHHVHSNTASCYSCAGPLPVHALLPESGSCSSCLVGDSCATFSAFEATTHHITPTNYIATKCLTNFYSLQLFETADTSPRLPSKPSAESPALPPLSDAPLSDRGPSARASLEQLTVAALLPVMQLTLLVRRVGVVDKWSVSGRLGTVR